MAAGGSAGLSVAAGGRGQTREVAPLSPPQGAGPLLPMVVDTDVVSYLFKRDTRGASFAPQLVGRVPVISFMTVAELDAWADQRNWGRAARNRLEQALIRYT